METGFLFPGEETAERGERPLWTIRRALCLLRVPCLPLQQHKRPFFKAERERERERSEEKRVRK